MSCHSFCYFVWCIFGVFATLFFIYLPLSLFLAILKFFTCFLVCKSLFSPYFSISPALFCCALLSLPTLTSCWPSFCLVYIYIYIFSSSPIDNFVSAFLLITLHSSSYFLSLKKSVYLSKLYEMSLEGKYAPPLWNALLRFCCAPSECISSCAAFYVLYIGSYAPSLIL